MIDRLTTTDNGNAFGMRDRLADMAGTAGTTGNLAARTVCITMLAGAGSRWVSSLQDAMSRGDALPAGADPSAPRGLFPVPNVMGFGPDPIPIAAYALAAVRDLGSHIIVVRGHDDDIRSRILEPLGYDPGSYRFATQEAPGGKPRGHGDAAWQTMDLWSGAEYVLVNFGGDASSPLTAAASLAAMDWLSREPGADAPGLLMPAALVSAPAYPIALDEAGLPRRFGHAKLSGGASGTDALPTAAPAGKGYTNVGVRVYRAAALAEAVRSIRSRYWSPEHGYSIPGNAPALTGTGQPDPAGGEFALDNVDAELAASGLARILAVARPEELSPVKSLDDLVQFGTDIRVVCADWKGRELAGIR